jgi:trehalose/maltose transport system substrate-binding protein
MQTSNHRSPIFSRRGFLASVAGGAATAILAACGGSKATNTPATSGGATTGTTTASGASAVAGTRATGSATSAATTSTGAGAASTAAIGSTTANASATTSVASTTAGIAGTPAATAATSASAVTGTTTGTTTSAGSQTFTIDNPPAVANATAAKQFSSQKLTYYGDSVGIGAQLDQALAKRFTQDTGIQVKVVPKPQAGTDAYQAFLRFFQAQSADLDVLMLDVIWPGAFAPHLLDLSSKLGAEAKQHYPNIIQNDTVNGKLVALPWFADVGILYYRTDLLKKYGYSAPPQTWDELQQQATKIMNGEKASNPNFTGFVFQGSAYEGLTCDALEWLASTGGGQIIENNKVTVNNPQATTTLNMVKGWVGTITPRGVTTFQEDAARNVFQGGNAAFMRNWPYAYAAAKQGSPIQSTFDAGALPAASGQPHVGTVGGWQLGVSKYSKNQDAGVEFVRYMAGPDVQAWRAVVGTFLPTIQSVAAMPAVVQAQPFLKNIGDVQRVTRPSTVLADQYNQGSTIFFQGVNQVLNGQDASGVLPGVAQQLQRLLG